MLLLLALPIFLSAAAAHRYLTLYALSNILIRHVRLSPPRWRTVGGLVVLTSALLLALRAVEVAITAGAPRWFNIVALVLAWDAIKFSSLAVLVTFRCAARSDLSVRRQEVALFDRRPWPAVGPACAAQRSSCPSRESPAQMPYAGPE